MDAISAMILDMYDKDFVSLACILSLASNLSSDGWTLALHHCLERFTDLEMKKSSASHSPEPPRV